MPRAASAPASASASARYCTKLRRACCNPQLVAPELGLASSKLAAFARLLQGLLENRHKVLVFSQFVDHLALIRAHLDEQAIAYQYLDGATPMAERKKRIEDALKSQGATILPPGGFQRSRVSAPISTRSELTCGWT